MLKAHWSQQLSQPLSVPVAKYENSGDYKYTIRANSVQEVLNFQTAGWLHPMVPSPCMKLTVSSKMSFLSAQSNPGPLAYTSAAWPTRAPAPAPAYLEPPGLFGRNVTLSGESSSKLLILIWSWDSKVFKTVNITKFSGTFYGCGLCFGSTIAPIYCI